MEREPGVIGGCAEQLEAEAVCPIQGYLSDHRAAVGALQNQQRSLGHVGAREVLASLLLRELPGKRLVLGQVEIELRTIAAAGMPVSHQGCGIDRLLDRGRLRRHGLGRHGLGRHGLGRFKLSLFVWVGIMT